MQSGMLWFDDDPHKQLQEKILRAAMYYERKFGQPPNLCFVHPSTLNGNGRGTDVVRINGVEIHPTWYVPPDHFWMGRAEPPADGELKAISPSLVLAQSSPLCMANVS